MITYDSKKWRNLPRNIFVTFKQSYYLRQLIWFMAIVLVYVSGVTVIALYHEIEVLTIDTVFFSLVGVILSLFLVFRLNTSYDRWWEGRKAWGKLVNDTRTFAIVLDTLVPTDDSERRRFFGQGIANFCVGLMWHLRDDIKYERFIHIDDSYADALRQAKHVPNYIASTLLSEIEVMRKTGMISEFDTVQLRALGQGFIDVLGICERIKKTPIPFSHSTFIKLFIIVYILILPFGLVNTFHILTIPAVMVMSFALLGVEVISEEIENPFGLDANDLPTGTISDGIRENVYELLKVPTNWSRTSQDDGEASVLH